MIDYSQIISRTKEQMGNECEFADVGVSFLHYVFPYIESVELELLIDCNEEIPANGVKITGYFVNSDDNYIGIYLSYFDQYAKPNTIMSLEDFEKCKISFSNFIKMIEDNSYRDINESRPIYDLCDYIVSHKNVEIIFNFVTNFVVPLGYEKDGNYIGKNKNYGVRTYDIVDIIDRVNNNGEDGQCLNLLEKFGKGINAVKISSDNDIDVYLTYFNGEWLAQLYKEDSVGLLSANVRSYLKRTNRVNKEIISTVKDTPQEFVAYNNGLSAIATGITVKNDCSDSFAYIEKIENFLIVNGGQTTATLYECMNDKLDLSQIIVPAKISIIKNEMALEYLISNISVYSNQQTAIKKSDPPSNSKFYICFEKLSKDILASKDMVEYHCFFERTNGQYNTVKRMHPKKTDPFHLMNPEKRKFTKLQLAQAIVSWEQKPDLVCRGQEKNFEYFNNVVKGVDSRIIDGKYFKASYGLIIIYRKLDELIKKASLPYKSSLIAYTLAYLSLMTEKKVDLLKIWNNQSTDIVLDNVLNVMIYDVYERLIDSPSNHPDIRMWSRKPECWSNVKNTTKSYSIELCEEEWNFFPENLAKIYIDNNINNVQVWKDLFNWASDTSVNLSAAQINMIHGMPAIIFKGKMTKKQENFAKSIFLAAVEEGYDYGKSV